MLHNVIGPPAEDEDFYGREAESARIWEDLLARNNILLLGPRRVGKSSMLRHLRKTAPLHGFLPIEVSLADISEEVQFVQRLYRAIGQYPEGKKIVKLVAGGPLGRFFRKFRKFKIWQVGVEIDTAAKDSWAELGESLTEALGKEANQKWLFLLDEVSLFAQHLVNIDPVRARTFLNWLRELRIGPRASRQNRWFITGSVGLPTVTRAVSLGDTINDLHSPYDHYGPFTRDVACRFLRDLALDHSVTLPDEAVQRILDRVEWLIPYHLQNVFSQLRGKNIPITPGIVDGTIDLLVDSAPLFSFWEERVRRHLKPADAKHALAILEPIGNDPNGVLLETLSQRLATHIPDPGERAKTLRFLLDLLIADGYLVDRDGRIRFLSPLLREYWRRHIINVQ